MSKKQISRQIILTILLIGGLLLLASGLAGYFMFVKQEIVPSDMFVKPQWARLECSPTDAFEGIETLNLGAADDGGTGLGCGDTEFTDACVAQIKITKQVSFYNPSINLKYKILERQTGRIIRDWTDVPNSKNVGIIADNIQLQKNQNIIIETRFLSGDPANAALELKYRPWKLYRISGGAKYIVNSANCEIRGSDDRTGDNIKSRILQSDVQYTALKMEGGEGSKWINYVNDWVYGPATNIFTHSTYGQVYCNNAILYEIVKLQMADGRLVKVNPTYTSAIVNGMGRELTRVDCCPSEALCGNDFKWKPTPPEEKECFTDAQCLGAGGPMPTDNTHYVKWQCINDKCVKSNPIAVECTTNSACPPGQICDLSTTNYGKCIQEPSTGYCGDRYCQSSRGENTANCIKDCPETPPSEITCKWFEQAYSKEDKDYGLFSWRKIIGSPIITKTEGCKTASWVWLSGIIIILLLILTIVLVTRNKKTGRKRR